MDFKNKVALVTGSTTGIGDACARAFAEAGADVIVSTSRSGRFAWQTTH